MKKKQAGIVIYKLSGKTPQLKVKIKEDSVWLTQAQLVALFQKTKQNISLHINNIFREGELNEKSVVKDYLTTAADGKHYNVKHYDLDVIISVGYRVKSKVGTHFRIWATNVLRDYVVKGYAVNQKRLQEAERHLAELSKTVKVIQEVTTNRAISRSETEGLLKVISDFTYGLHVLDDFDRNSLKIQGTKKKPRFILDYESASKSIETMKKEIQSDNKEMGMFGIEKDKSLEGSLKNIYQTIDGKDAYPTIEEKAAHLLYFVIKNHPFVDGNKRIAASLFLWFLQGNDCLYKSDGSRRLVDNALVALTLMTAVSRPEDKDIMIRVIVNLINKRN